MYGRRMDLRIFVEPQQGATYDQLAEVARAAERLGFDGFFRSDHLLRMGGVDGRPGPTDAWVTLGALARETSGIRLGTLVTSCTFRHPSLLAVAAAQVDEMSGGRIELGLGTGWYVEEHAAYGIDFPPLGERFDRLEEQLEIVTGLWGTAPGDTYSFSGRHFTLTDSPALPKPLQAPRPPIIVGGAGARRTPRLAARFADEFNVPFHSVEATAAQFDRVRAACEAAGRDPASMVLSAAQTIVCGADDAAVARGLEAIGRDREGVGLVGTPTQIVDQVTSWARLGVSRLYLQFLDIDDLVQLELIGEEVGPRV